MCRREEEKRRKKKKGELDDYIRVGKQEILDSIPLRITDRAGYLGRMWYYKKK